MFDQFPILYIPMISDTKREKPVVCGVCFCLLGCGDVRWSARESILAIRPAYDINIVILDIAGKPISEIFKIEGIFFHVQGRPPGLYQPFFFDFGYL